MPIIQANRQISVKGPLELDVLLFRSMRGNDRLSDLSEYRVELLSEKKDIKFGDVLGKPMTIELKLQSGGTREFNGIVAGFSSAGGFGKFTSYHAVLRPWLWLLSRSSDCRIFQEKSVLDIVKDVFEKPVYAGLADFSVAFLEKTYPKLDYCVQYRETDLNFVRRLLEHAGIYFHFKHAEGKHTMVLADSYGAHAPVAGYETVQFATDDRRDEFGDERISSWVTEGEIQSSGFEMNDFDFDKKAASISGSLTVKSSIPAAFGQPEYQQYDYPGGYLLAASGRDIAGARMESLHGQCEQSTADSNARGLVAGALFGLTEHPVEALNRDYLLIDVEYRLASDDYESTGGYGSDKLFECSFRAIGSEHRFHPMRKAPKPHVQGPQTAIVVGKAGEEIWTDKYGRVKVQFHWDRVGVNDEKSSCWVRVSQSWAGQRWGGMFVPRIGMEVIVEFLEGDPDRPLITGCVYNSEAMPPYELPANQTRSTMKSNSSKGGAGFNEIRFEDKQDAEEIFIQAQKDCNRVVKHDDTLKVGFLASEPGSQTIEIKHDQKLEVGNDQTVHIIKNQKEDIDGTHAMKIGKTSVIEAATSIELKVGGSSIVIEPAKITLKSTQIAIEGSAKVEVKGTLVEIKGTPVKIN
jgi:type VI secretion system secreted protein VgrG